MKTNNVKGVPDSARPDEPAGLPNGPQLLEDWFGTVVAQESRAGGIRTYLLSMILSATTDKVNSYYATSCKMNTNLAILLDSKDCLLA